jgi:hypothetical protein
MAVIDVHRMHGRGESLEPAGRRAGEAVPRGHAVEAINDRYKICLDGEEVQIDGTLWNRAAPAISCGDDVMRCHAKGG